MLALKISTRAGCSGGGQLGLMGGAGQTRGDHGSRAWTALFLHAGAGAVVRSTERSITCTWYALLLRSQCRGEPIAGLRRAARGKPALQAFVMRIHQSQAACPGKTSSSAGTKFADTPDSSKPASAESTVCVSPIITHITPKMYKYYYTRVR